MGLVFAPLAPILAAAAPALTPPVVNDPIHHWSSLDWILSSGRVSQVNDAVGANTLLPTGSNLLVMSVGGRDYWAGENANSLASAASGSVPQGTIILACANIPAAFARLFAWGDGTVTNSLTTSNVGVLNFNFGGVSQPGPVLPAGDYIIGCSWDLSGPSGSRKTRVWVDTTLGGSSNTQTQNVFPSSSYDTPGGPSMGFTTAAVAVVSFGASFTDDGPMAAKMADFKAFWQP
jgi:hypothetical protein